MLGIVALIAVLAISCTSTQNKEEQTTNDSTTMIDTAAPTIDSANLVLEVK